MDITPDPTSANASDAATASTTPQPTAAAAIDDSAMDTSMMDTSTTDTSMMTTPSAPHSLPPAPGTNPPQPTTPSPSHPSPPAPSTHHTTQPKNPGQTRLEATRSFMDDIRRDLESAQRTIGTALRGVETVSRQLDSEIVSQRHLESDLRLGRYYEVLEWEGRKGGAEVMEMDDEGDGGVCEEGTDGEGDEGVVEEVTDGEGDEGAREESADGEKDEGAREESTDGEKDESSPEEPTDEEKDKGALGDSTSEDQDTKAETTEPSKEPPLPDLAGAEEGLESMNLHHEGTAATEPQDAKHDEHACEFPSPPGGSTPLEPQAPEPPVPTVTWPESCELRARGAKLIVSIYRSRGCNDRQEAKALMEEVWAEARVKFAEFNTRLEDLQEEQEAVKARSRSLNEAMIAQEQHFIDRIGEDNWNELYQLGIGCAKETAGRIGDIDEATDEAGE